MHVYERERVSERAEGWRRGSELHGSDGTLIRSDSSITASRTCDKTGTRNAGVWRLKVAKMESERHQGDRVCTYGTLDINFCSGPDTHPRRLCHAPPPSVTEGLWNFGSRNYRFMELEIYQIAAVRGRN